MTYQQRCAVTAEADPRAAAAAASGLDPWRAAAIEAARGWLGTPYHHMARLKGVGCDCLTLLAAIYYEAGVIPAIDIPYYPPDWHLHRSAERYIEGLLAYAREVETPGPGDGALFKFGRCFAHGAVVVEWPRVIHAWNGLGVVRGDASKSPLARRAVRFFSPF